MFFLVFLVKYSFCWWAHAHQLIGAIAMKQLTDEENNILKKAIGGRGLPEQTVAECSTWQDDLKDISHLKIMETWHFSNMNYITDTWNASVGIIKPETYNVGHAVASHWKTLTDPTTTDPWAISYSLRGLAHFVGDIHTPHHNVEYYSKEFPKGDNGGTQYFMNCNYGSTCLHIHFIWDAAGLHYQINFPMVGPHLPQFNQNVSRIMKEYPESNFMTSDVNIELWMNESFAMAKKDGYSVELRSWPSKEYFEIVQNDSNERIAVAGYRLGQMLKHILNGNQLRQQYNIKSSTTTSEIMAWTLDCAFFIICCVCIVFRLKRSTSYNNQYY